MAKRFTRVILVTWLAAFAMVMFMAQGRDNGDKPQDQAAATSRDEQATVGEIEVTELATGLRTPTAVAVRPRSGRSQVEIWIADGGDQQVVRYHSEAPETFADAITELGESAEEAEEPQPPTPIGLHFQSRNRLILTSGGDAPLRVFDINGDELPLQGSDADKVAEPQEEWPGGLAAVARNPDKFYFVGAGGERANWIATSAVKGAVLGPIEKFRDTTEVTEPGNLRAVVFSQKGYMVLGFAGDESSESMLAFLDPHLSDAPPVMVLSTGLADISALAYHPKSGSLYAADSAWGDADKGGIYRLDAKSAQEGGNESCQPVLIAKLPYATAIAFDTDGTLYAVSATSPDGTGEPQGKLIKITGDL